MRSIHFCQQETFFFFLILVIYKSMLQDSMNSRKAFSAFCWLWKHFSCRKLLRCLKKWSSVGEKSGEYGRWGTTSKPNLFNFWSTGCVIVLWRIGPILLTNTGGRGCSFQCISSICWAYFSDVMVSLGFRKLQWIRWAADHQTVPMTFYWCDFGFGKCSGASQSPHWADHLWLSYKIPFPSNTTIWLNIGSLLLHRIGEDTSKR